jgi:tetratricopeptide (TPR) repeat protein
MNLKAWRHRLRARLFELLRRPEQAIHEYRAALQHDPASAAAARSLAYRLAARGQEAEAERYFREALRLEPQNAVTWFNLGFLYDRQHAPAKAIEAFREATRLDPKLDRAWYGLGLCQATLGQYEDAVKSFERTVQLESMSPHAWYQLGLAHHARRDPDKVKTVIEQLHRFDPKMTRKLILDTGRGDLAHLVKDLRV